MNLKCMINGKINGVSLPHFNDNKLLQGNTISEDYSETLDSGSIILTNIPKILDLEPYDDVFIWDCDYMPNFTGFSDATILRENNKFYKHFLVDRYTEERNLLNQNNYTYKIELFSETKGMENIVLPNIKITQPLNIEKKLSTYQYMERYLRMYSPKIKVYNNGSWSYQQKYTLSQEMYDMFNVHYCQELCLNSPTLRELFTKLMVSKDSIPIVIDNVIYPMCLSKTRGTFNLNRCNKSFIVANKTSDNYVTQFRTNYNNALSGKPTCHRVEHLGFRNSNDAIMTINNMQLETGFPIYKINKIYACYYKKVNAKFRLTPGEYSGDMAENQPYYFYCKQDITPFCVLNNERQALYKDIRLASTARTVEEMKKCYYFTLGYSIGSNTITGFGQMYSYLASYGLTTWNKTQCGFRNLINNLNALYPAGIENPEDLKEKILAEPRLQSILPYFSHLEFSNVFEGFDVDKAPVNNENVPTVFIETSNGIINDITNWALKKDSTVIKGLTFLVDYEGFYNGAVTTQKEVYKNRVDKTDNQSDSLPIMDIDGISRERKAEKMGNKSYTINARYTNWSDVQDVGTIFTINGSEENQSDDEEIIIYHRDISMYDNCINVTYFGQESFVLKNFFTSVFAKQRLYNVLDYGNSTTRAENIKDIILLSKTKKYQISPNFSAFNMNLSTYLSCLNNDSGLTRINTALLSFAETNATLNNKDKYFTDVNSFIYGNSMCVNVKMFDNITMGENIDPEHLSGKFWGGEKDANYIGTTINLCPIYQDNETGRIEYMRVSLYSKVAENYNLYFYDELSNIKNGWFMPKLSLPVYTGGDDVLGAGINTYTKEVCKDANEIIDMTFQTQLLVDKKDKHDVYISPKMLELSNLMGFKSSTIASNYYDELTNKIVLIPFQFKAKNERYDNENTTEMHTYSSLLGFIVRVPNTALNNIVGENKKFKFSMDLDVTSNKGRAYSFLTTSFNKGKIGGYKMNMNDNTNGLTFINADNGKLAVRIDCFNIAADVIQSNDIDDKERIWSERSNTTPNSPDSGVYFYLQELNRNYVIERNQDKNDFTYFSNIQMMKMEHYEDIVNNYPVLINYFEGTIDLEGKANNANTTYSLVPCDTINCQYNNMFYGYTASQGFDPKNMNSSISIASTYNFEPIGSTFHSYILNYFDEETDSYSLNGNSNLSLPTYTFATYEVDYETEPNLSFLVPYIETFYDLEGGNDIPYVSWEAPTDDVDVNISDNTIICVGGAKITTPLAETKVRAFRDMEGYDILMNGNVPRDYTNIFSIIRDSNINNTPGYNTGRLHINLTYVPYNYESIQEWIYNVDIQAYEFVCGFNISDEDRDRGYIDIYLSLVGDLDLQVYKDGILYGKVSNKVDNNSSDVIPINQD